jgi:hypothetical protein
MEPRLAVAVPATILSLRLTLREKRTTFEQTRRQWGDPILKKNTAHLNEWVDEGRKSRCPLHLFPTSPRLVNIVELARTPPTKSLRRASYGSASD